MEILELIKKLKEIDNNININTSTNNSTNTNSQSSQALNNPNDVSILKLNNNFASIRSILPHILEENNNINNSELQNRQIYDFLELLEINELIKSYKKNYNNINTDNNYELKHKLKKEAVLYIQSNINNDNRHLLDAILKMLEINQILNKSIK